MKKTALLLGFCVLLGACSGRDVLPSTSESEASSSSELTSESLSESVSESVSESIPDQESEEVSMKFQTYNGSFDYGEDGATSKSSNNLAIVTNRPFANGTFKARITANGQYDAGIIFGASAYPESYYFLGMNSVSGSKMRLVKHSNGEDVELGSCYVSAGYNQSANIELKVEYIDGEIKCFFDEKMYIYRVDEEPLTGHYVGVKSKNAGTVYQSISVSDELTFKEYETLIVGHSYMELWKNYKEDLSEFTDIFNIGIGGTATNDWIGHKEEIVKYNPKNLIYMIGINDYPRKTSVSTIVNNIKQLIDPVLAELPETKICLVSVNQCVTHTKYKQAILDTNVLLKQYVDANERLLYADIDDAFLDESGNPIDSCFVDGLHPTEDSYKVIAQAIYDAFANEKENTVHDLLDDLGTTSNKNEGNDFVLNATDQTLVTSSEDGYLISSGDYQNFTLGIKLSETSAVNPFFDKVAQEAILIGGSYSDGKYSGYAITFDNTGWIELVYIDGTNNNACTFVDGWNISFLNKDLILVVDDANVSLSMVDGTAIPNTFGGKTFITLDNYAAGKIGILSYDGAPTTYTLNSFFALK